MTAKELIKLGTLLLGMSLLASCGGDSASNACSSSLVLGSWNRSTTNETITFASSCAYTSDLCGGTGTTPNISNSSGSVLISITTSNGLSGCLPVGSTSCVYTVNSTALTFSCSGGPVVTYDKQ